MRRLITSFVAAFLLVSAAFSLSRAGQPRVEILVGLRNAQGEQIGNVTLLEEEASGVFIRGKVSKLPPGRHGFHIHAVGKCEPPDFLSAGAHFNPDGKPHGLKNPAGPHAGDLPTLIVGPEGDAEVNVVAPHVTLGAGHQTLVITAGTALVIHAEPDDDNTDPDGNSGARIACGVITKE
jgi:superoxide dismutase, Cu-Zn family